MNRLFMALSPYLPYPSKCSPLQACVLRAGRGILFIFIVLCVFWRFSAEGRESNYFRYGDMIVQAAFYHDVEPALIAAIIHTESNFNPNARSGVGAKGLMQIMPSTGRHLQIKNIYDPWQNISAGSKYLKELLLRFEGDRELAVAAYNAGPGAIQRYKGVPPYKETRNFIKKVFDLYAQYARTYPTKYDFMKFEVSRLSVTVILSF